MLLLVIVALTTLFNGLLISGLILLVCAGLCRIFFECMMVAFKNNAYLRRIAEALESAKQ